MDEADEDMSGIDAPDDALGTTSVVLRRLLSLLSGRVTEERRQGILDAAHQVLDVMEETRARAEGRAIRRRLDELFRELRGMRQLTLYRRPSSDSEHSAELASLRVAVQALTQQTGILAEEIRERPTATGLLNIIQDATMGGAFRIVQDSPAINARASPRGAPLPRTGKPPSDPAHPACSTPSGGVALAATASLDDLLRLPEGATKVEIRAREGDTATDTEGSDTELEDTTTGARPEAAVVRAEPLAAATGSLTKTCPVCLTLTDDMRRVGCRACSAFWKRQLRGARVPTRCQHEDPLECEQPAKCKWCRRYQYEHFWRRIFPGLQVPAPSLICPIEHMPDGFLGGKECRRQTGGGSKERKGRKRGEDVDGATSPRRGVAPTPKPAKRPTGDAGGSQSNSQTHRERCS